MSNRRKYPINGIHFFENARQHLERNNFRRIPIGTVGGINGWYLTMQKEIIDNVVYYYPFISSQWKGKINSRYFFNIRKNNVPYEYFSYLEPERLKIPVDEWLNEENGYLTNGKIKIEYGFQIEGILSDNNIWTFNFYDPLFDCQKQRNMISFCKNPRNPGSKIFHCHKQLLTHHSTYFTSDFKKNQMIRLTTEVPGYFNCFLQFSHGVRDRTSFFVLYNALKYAQKYKLFNVIQLIDQFMVLDSWDVDEFYLGATVFELKYCLANFLKNQKTSKELAEKLKKVNIEAMSGEAMKKCVKRFFESRF